MILQKVGASEIEIDIEEFFHKKRDTKLTIIVLVQLKKIIPVVQLDLASNI